MHQFFATLFSLLLSLCHHTSSSHPLEAVDRTPADPTGTAILLPDRYQLAHGRVIDASYSVSACLSCRQTSGTSIER